MNEKKLQITIILPNAGIAGGIRVIAIYAQRLQRRGHNVTVVSTPWTPPGRLARAKCQMHNWVERFGFLPPRPPDPSHFRGLDVKHIQIKRIRPVKNSDVPDGDVVVATWWQTARWVADLSSRKGAKAYFVQDYGAHSGQPMDRVAETWSLPLHKIVISRWLMELIRQYSGDACVDYVPNAVDHEQFHALPRGKQARATVGFLYNTAPQKGCDIILEAIRLARRECPELQVVAYGPCEPELQLPLPPGTRYSYFAPDSRLREIYAACDAWLFGSRSEGFGLPILEAMACRTPVIGTPAGAAPDLLAEGGGVLVRANDPHHMAEAILRVVRLPEAQWKSMSDSAHLTASRYTWEQATDLFESALRRAIAKPAAMVPALA